MDISVLEDRAAIAVSRLRRLGIELTGEEERIIYDASKLLGRALGKIKRVFPPGHGVEHMFRVLEISIVLCKKYGGDLTRVVLASLFHDIMRGEENHAEKSAIFAQEFLKNTEFSIYAEDIATIIREHSYSYSRHASCIESQILQDADRLDALGAIGIARVFSFGAYRGRDLYDFVNPRMGGSLAHFYEKILKLPELMNTPLARIIAKRRVGIIRWFLKNILCEINLEDFHGDV